MIGSDDDCGPALAVAISLAPVVKSYSDPIEAAR